MLPRLDSLKSVLLNSGIQQDNPALYQVINALIQNLRQGVDELATQISNVSTTVVVPPDISGSNFVTSTDETATLVNSRQLLGGTNITLDLTTPGELTINGASTGANPNLTYLTTDDETADLPNSVQLLAGTNVTFDDSVPNQRTISASGSGASGYWTPLTDGNITETDLIFANGEAIAVFVPV